MQVIHDNNITIIIMAMHCIIFLVSCHGLHFRRVGGHGYSSLLVCYPRRAWAAAIQMKIYLSIHLYLYHLSFTEQYLGLNSGRF